MHDYRKIEQALDEFLRHPDENTLSTELASSGLGLLPILKQRLREDLPIAATEKLEGVLKLVLKPFMSGSISGKIARQINYFQRELGFILKYKSYAIKASSPLGYSVFLQEPGEGFSFQRHITHKVEVFHILDVGPGGYVFLCDYEDWEKNYQSEQFSAWLEGEPNPRFDPYKIIPEPGDVFIMSELGIVHTVIGCTLEEYATVSTDMVNRLHDQNAGKTVPKHFTRAYVESRLPSLNLPKQNRIFSALSNNENQQSVDRVSVQGGYKVPLTDSFVYAAHYGIEPHKASELANDPKRACFVRIYRGSGTMFLGDESELRGSAECSFPFNEGDLFMIPPGVYYKFDNESDEVAQYSEHRISALTAFI